jgi:hypothetical protein
VAAYCQVAQLLIADEDPEGAAVWAARAAELAARMRDNRAATDAHRTVGWVEFFAGEPDGLAKLERCIDLYEAAGLEEDAAITRVVIARTAARLRLHDLAERHISAGLAYSEGIDFDVYRYYLLSWQAQLRLAAGRWDEAAQIAAICLGEPCPFARIHALVALGLVRARRGDPDPWTPLDEALQLARPRRSFSGSRRSRLPAPRQPGWKAETTPQPRPRIPPWTCQFPRTPGTRPPWCTGGGEQACRRQAP